MKTPILIRLALLAAVTIIPLSAQQNLQSTRDALGEWVETRQLISKEKSDWLTEESILADTKNLLARELERIDAALSTLEQSSTAADEERTSLAASREKLTEATAVVESEISGLEIQLKRMISTLPEPLIERIKPLIRRLPDDPEATKLSMGERVQNIVGILSQADKFNTTLTATSESREIESGKVVEVRTLYWGLAMAYYVDASGAYAGIGYPGPDGWEWPRIEGAGSAIRKLVDVYEGGESIQFVEVPARIQ